MYGAFFEAPRRATVSSKRGKGMDGKWKEGEAKGKGKERRLRFEEEVDQEEVDEPVDDVDEGDEGRDIMGTLKGDLFDDEEEEEPDEKGMFCIPPRRR